MFTSLHRIRDWRSLHASIPSRRWIHVLLALPPAPGQAGPVELVVDDAVISGSRGRRSLFHALAVVANELLLGRAGLTPVELPATGEPGDREHGNHQDARDTRRAHDHLHSGLRATSTHCDTHRSVEQDEGKGRVMVRRDAWRGTFLVIALSMMVAGCSSLGAAQQAPVDPVGTGDLKPAQRDRDAGVVAIRSGFDLKKYSTLAVVSFPVTDSGVMSKEEVKLLLTMPAYFQAQLVGRLRGTNMFTRVDPVAEGNTPPTGAGLLRLEGRITRLA